MRLFARFFRLIWGADVPRPLRPVLAVQFAGSVAGSTLFTFVGIWAVDELGASNAQLAFGFLFGAVAAAIAGFAGGHLSDHLGRRPVILTGWSLQAAFVLTFLTAGHHVYLGLLLMSLGAVFGSIGGAADQAMVADLVPPEQHEAAYASVRVAANLGVTCGPPLGGALLIGEHWPFLFVGVSALSTIAFVIAWRFLPRRGDYSPTEPPTRSSFAVIVRDRPFLLFFVSGVFAFLVYVAYETVLPIAAVKSYDLAPSTWGFLVIVNPALVTFFQLRLTRRVEHFPAAPKLVLAMLLMGGSYLLLVLDSSLPTIALMILVFVIGEMLWVPTSQAIVAALAPEDVRGAYMGAFGATAAFAFALGPFVGLQLRGAAGDDATWFFFAGLGVAAAITGALATRYVRRTPRVVTA